ncbi:Uncharacterised protein [Corynebacterium renale]|nr:Uncharacterised protein [Corynebacterium renale]
MCRLLCSLNLGLVLLAELSLDVLAQCGLIGGAGCCDWSATSLLSFLYLLTQLVIFILQLCKSVFYEIEELVNFVLVVAPLTDRRLAKGDIVHVCWCKRHVAFPSIAFTPEKATL